MRFRGHHFQCLGNVGNVSNHAMYILLWLQLAGRMSSHVSLTDVASPPLLSVMAFLSVRMDQMRSTVVSTLQHQNSVHLYRNAYDREIKLTMVKKNYSYIEI